MLPHGRRGATDQSNEQEFFEAKLRVGALSYSATTVKSWFQYRCDRKTRYESMNPAEREAIQILKDPERDDSWAQEGVAFEEAVLRRLGRERSILRPASRDEKLDEQLTAAFLRNEKKHEFAHQAVLMGGQPLRAFLGTSRDVEFSRTYPDLLQRIASDPLTFRIIDIKATQVATYFHKAQVAFYALVLKSMLAEMRSSARIDEVGQIWHLKRGSSGCDGDYEVLDFNLRSYMRLVEDFFANTVPRIQQQRVGPGRDETFFHLYYKCEQCGYLGRCSQYLEGEPGGRDISAVPGMTHEAKRALERMGIRSVGALAKAKGIRAQPNIQSWSLRRNAELLRHRAESLLRGKAARLENRYSYLMPGRVDVALYLVIDGDPVQGDIATLGYLLDWQGRLEWSTAVLSSGQPEDELRGLQEVLGKLVMDLRRLHDLNERLGEASRLHAHIFLYEPVEATDIQKALGRHLEDPLIRTALLDLVRLFPPDEVIPEPEYRGHHHLPATAVRSVMEQLYVLPVHVSYDLRQVTAALAGSGLTEVYRPEQPFRRDFSTRLSVEVIRQLRRRAGGVVGIERDLRARLTSLRALTRWLLERNAEAKVPFLRLRKQPFAFQTQFDPLDSADLEILRAYELLAERSGLLADLVRLAQPWEVRRDNLQCLARLTLLTHKDGRPHASFRFGIPVESRDAELGPDDLGLVLTDDDPDVRLDPTRWDSYMVNIRPDDGTAEVNLKMWRQRYLSAEFQSLLLKNPDENWFVDSVFRDFNTPRVVRFLEALGGDEQ